MVTVVAVPLILAVAGIGTYPDLLEWERDLPVGTQSLADWEFVGTFRLKDGNGKTTIVRLYVEDPAAIAARKSRRGEIGMYIYPHPVDVVAIYRPDGGKWKMTNVYSASRCVVYVGVKERIADRVVLEMRKDYKVRREHGESADEYFERGRRINTRFEIIISLSDGIPIKK